MTPTDALIEKMARAHYAQFPYWKSFRPIAWEDLPDETRELQRSLMRAAYEAEHEEDGK